MRKPILLMLALVLLLPVIASAQMMGGGNHHGSSPVTPPSNGMHGGNGSMNGMSCPMSGDHGMGRGLAVATDGTLFVTRRAASGEGSQLVAIRAGGVLWAKDLTARAANVLISGDRVIAISAGSMHDDSETARKTSVSAYAVATGALLWTIDVDGVARDAELFTGGVYVVLFTGNNADSMDEGQCSGGGHGDNESSMMQSSVAAIGTDGKLLWTLPLQP